MALKLISSQSGDSTDAIEVTEREPISRDEIRCSCDHPSACRAALIARQLVSRRAFGRLPPPWMPADSFATLNWS